MIRSADGLVRCTPCRTGLMCQKCLSLVYKGVGALFFSSRRFALTYHTCCVTDLMVFQVLLGAVKLVHIQSDCGWKRHRMQMRVCFFFSFVFLQRQCRRLSSPDGQAHQHQLGAHAAAHGPLQGPRVQEALVGF